MLVLIHWQDLYVTYREPDFGIGFVLWGMSMGQILSFIMFITALLVYICIKFKK